MSRIALPTLLLTLMVLAACGTPANTASSAATQTREPVVALAPITTTVPTTNTVAVPVTATTPPSTPVPVAPTKQVVAGPPPDGIARPRPAPEITDEVWLNGERTSLAALRQQGKVVLVEFWTFECYNCRNVLPALRQWHSKYASQGLTIVGVHYPEFSTERQIPNVRQALKDLDIKYLVTIDNDGRTWQAYNQNAWPSLYLVDKQGNIRFQHVGEGAYDRTEQWIQYLLHEQS
ncbi:MAG: redoxin domain-containing protein [Herpetosiphonaceae bacterium]|nr:redoxin domain-containing protein [Herpetosiphonaceae bacterium]